MFFLEARAFLLQRPGNRANILDEAVQGIGEIFPHQRIVNELALLIATDKPRGFEQLQMLGNGGLAHVEAGGDLPRRQIGLGQIGEDFPPGRGCQRFKDLFHKLPLKVISYFAKYQNRNCAVKGGWKLRLAGNYFRVSTTPPAFHTAAASERVT